MCFNKQIGRANWLMFLLVCLLVILAGKSGQAEEQVARTTLKVEKIACGACLRVIDAELHKVPGILGMTADLAVKQITVDHDRKISSAEVAVAVTAAGYPARVLDSAILADSQAHRFQREPGFGSGPACCNPGGSNPVADSWRELCRRFFPFLRRN